MKVLHLIQAASPLYGMERTTLLTLGRLLGLGVDVELAVVQEREMARADRVSVAAREMGIPVSVLPSLGAVDPLLVAGTRRHLSRRGPDLVHAHGLKADVLAVAAWPDRARHVLATAHGWLSRTRRERLYEALDCWALRRMGAVISHSRAYRRRLIERGIRPGRIRLVPSGVDVSEQKGAGPAGRTNMRARWGAARSDLAIGIIGRLSPEKGHDVFLRAAEIVAQEEPRARFIIVGEGELRRDLEARAARSPIAARVVITGFIEQMADVYRALDVVVSASHLEAMPRVILEAMAMGRAIVATAAGGTTDLVRDGETGFLIPPGDAQALADRILRVAGNARLRGRFGAAARRRAETAFSLDARAEALVRIYEDTAHGAAVKGEGQFFASRTPAGPHPRVEREVKGDRQFSASRTPASLHPRVSVVIPCLNEARHVGRVLAAVLDQDLPRDDYEVIVVDGGSEDGTREMVERFDVTLMSCERGIGRQRNHGSAAARAPVIAFLDSDCVPARDWLRRGLAHFENEGNIVLGGRILPPEEGTWVQQCWRVHMLARAGRAAEAFRAERIGRRLALYLHTANLFVSREAFREVGGFDESLYSGEDTMFCNAAYSAGHRVAYDEAVRVEHLGEPATCRAFLRQQLWHSNAAVWRALAHAGLPAGSRARLYGLLHLLAVCGIVLAFVAVLLARLTWPAVALAAAYLGAMLWLACAAGRRAGDVRHVPGLMCLYMLYGWARASYLLGAGRSVSDKPKR